MLTIKSGIFQAAVAGAALLAMAGVARAAPITSIYNTGVDAGHAVRADLSTPDLHYILVVVPGGTAVTLVRDSTTGYPIPPYLADNTISRWIGPNNDTSLDGAIGVYDYQTTFDLTGFIPATATLSGRWATDNEGVDILINTLLTGNTIPDPTAGAFTTWHAFSITAGFGPGINTLDFLVNNDGGPTALRVEFTGTASLAAAPEPATLALFGAGLAGLGAIRRRRKAKA